MKLKLTILLILFAGLSSAQKKIDTYYSSDLGRTLNIRASLDNDGKPVLFLEVFSGILKDTYYFKIEDNLAAFIEALSLSKARFVEWEKRVKENDVQYTTRAMDVSFPAIEVVFYDAFENKYTTFATLDLKPIFRSSDNHKCVFQLSAVGDRSKDQIYSILLAKDKEFEKLIAKISAEALLEKLNKAK